MTGLHTPLSPLSFLERSARVYPNRTAVIDGETTRTFAELAADAQHRAQLLADLGIRPGDRVAYMAPNTLEMALAQFSVPLAGAVLVPLNIRLTSAEIRFILEHSGARVFVIDAEYIPVVQPLISGLTTVATIAVDRTADPSAHLPEGFTDLADLLTQTQQPWADPTGQAPREFQWAPHSELDPLGINYTSGTTGNPKGVVVTHRQAYTNAINQVLHSHFGTDSVYLWTLPIFHCNGWCGVWALTAAGSTQVCLRAVRGPKIWELIDRHRVTHFNGAPTVVRTVLAVEEAHPLNYTLRVTCGGAPLDPRTLAEVEALGFSVTHSFGMTETAGPYTVAYEQDEWKNLPSDTRAALLARQGVGQIGSSELRVVDRETDSDGLLVDVPADGATIGEVVVRGNTVMASYYRNPEATAKAFAGGWLHTGDLGVMHADGYVELKDRAKDIIISGGENISTIEVEHAIGSHPLVAEAAVIGVPDERWGERPRAYVVTRDGAELEDEVLTAHVRARLAGFKVPREYRYVAELPKTSTGKISKVQLREG